MLNLIKGCSYDWFSQHLRRNGYERRRKGAGIPPCGRGLQLLFPDCPGAFRALPRSTTHGIAKEVSCGKRPALRQADFDRDTQRDGRRMRKGQKGPPPRLTSWSPHRITSCHSNVEDRERGRSTVVLKEHTSVTPKSQERMRQRPVRPQGWFG